MPWSILFGAFDSNPGVVSLSSNLREIVKQFSIELRAAGENFDTTIFLPPIKDAGTFALQVSTANFLGPDIKAAARKAVTGQAALERVQASKMMLMSSLLKSKTTVILLMRSQQHLQFRHLCMKCRLKRKRSLIS